MLQSIVYTAIFLVESLSMHIASNNSDVIVTYEGHAEANRSGDIWKGVMKDYSYSTTEDPALLPDPNFQPTETDDVVFVPHEKQVFRNDDRFHEDVKISDVLANRRSLGDVAAEAQAAAKTDGPPADILFVSGKNNDHTEYEKKQRKEEVQQKRAQKITEKLGKFSCENLECNNTVKSVCGGKIEHNRWKYRLFLNECYFRKVNCGFKYENNRYIRVKWDFCRTVGEHLSSRPPYFFKPLPVNIVKPDLTETVWNASARRSLHIMMDGTHCKHPCPISCTNDYEPECAVTNTGERRVFVNHCKLDYNSCWNGIYWRKRPMSECVGGKKADMHQNSAFINWMRQVGIVDKKGRLKIGKT